MKLKCIANVKGYFTKGKEYIVISRLGIFRYIIVDDKGDYRTVDMFANHRFEVLNEE